MNYVFNITITFVVKKKYSDRILRSECMKLLVHISLHIIALIYVN
jgi:hypothetical protein